MPIVERFFAIQVISTEALLQIDGHVMLFVDRASAEANARTREMANHGQVKEPLRVVEVEQVLTVKG